MISAVKMWIFGLVAAAAATAVLYELLPKGSSRERLDTYFRSRGLQLF